MRMEGERSLSEAEQPARKSSKIQGVRPSHPKDTPQSLPARVSHLLKNGGFSRALAATRKFGCISYRNLRVAPFPTRSKNSGQGGRSLPNPSSQLSRQPTVSRGRLGEHERFFSPSLWLERIKMGYLSCILLLFCCFYLSF